MKQFQVKGLIGENNSAMITDVAGDVPKLAIFGITGDIPFLADLQSC